MMKLKRPKEISGIINAPPSKSFMQRVVACAILAGNETKIINPSFCLDSLAALSVAENLGFKITRTKEEISIIKDDTREIVPLLNCGESGLCIRMFSPTVALWDREFTLTGVGSLTRRTVEMIELPLRKLGVACSSNNGFIPLKVKGPLHGGTLVIDGSISSQFLTGLLISLPVVQKDSIINVTNLKSKPYIDITLTLLKDFGIHIDHINYEIFTIPGRQKYSNPTYMIEGDWSSAADMLVAGALGGEVEVRGLNVKSCQADKVILDVLHDVGATLEINDRIRVKKNNLHAFECDATNSPDLFPILCVLACNCEGTSAIHGTSRLQFKESDRAATLLTEFKKLGADIQLEENTMIIKGKKLIGGSINSHNDHRIAMAAALASINARDEIIIDDMKCIDKSYPEFIDDFKKIGGIIHE